MKASTIAAAVAGVLVIAVAGVASATQTTSSLQVYDGVQGDMISGNGIPIDNFTQDSYADSTSGNTIYVSLKARDRDTGEANSQTGNVYYIDPGYSSTNTSKPNLEYDYQFDPGNDGTTDYYLQMKVDFDPSAGTDFATIGGNIDSFWATTDGFFPNGTDGTGHVGTNAWNTSAVPYVISNSGNLGFSFWSTAFGKSYDPNQSGDYEIQFNVFDPTDTAFLASSTIHAIVGSPLTVSVPEPGEIELMGLGLLLIGGLTWRSRRKQEHLA